jgi:hypothetical protein
LIGRGPIVFAAALLLSIQVIRNAAVAALATNHPATAARFWAEHPKVEISLGLAKIGKASRDRKPIDPQILTGIQDAASKSPLSPEPFLVRGVAAQMAGDLKAAKRAFDAAQRRDPRSLPAAYFLANYYLSENDSLNGLNQSLLLARLSPGGLYGIAPFLATYASSQSHWPLMRKLFRSHAGLEDAVLLALASDPRNADAILALADPVHWKPESKWLATLVSSLVAGGQYARAHAIWSSMIPDESRSGELLYDADFSLTRSPPPFNWNLAESAIGLAERQPGGRLHVLFYGNMDGPLASELLLLPPGTYRLRMRIDRASARPQLLRWSIRCDKSSEVIGIVTIDQAARHRWTFKIPSNCPAQWLELSGRSGDIAQQSNATISDLDLESVGPL